MKTICLEVEIIIFPVLTAETAKASFNPEQFFAVSQLQNVDRLPF